jgi:hypothetical protein
MFATRAVATPTDDVAPGTAAAVEPISHVGTAAHTSFGQKADTPSLNASTIVTNTTATATINTAAAAAVAAAVCSIDRATVTTVNTIRIVGNANAVVTVLVGGVIAKIRSVHTV